jgi:hypothetical protein
MVQMKKTATALTLIAALLVSTLAGILVVRTAKAPQIGPYNEGDIEASIAITSPESKVYNTENVTVAFTIESEIQPLGHFTGGLFDPFLRYACFLDYDSSKLSPGYPTTSVELVLSYNSENNISTCRGTLTNLTQGPHNLTAWVQKELNYLSYGLPVGSAFSTVSFYVDSVSPHIIILFPETKTYNTSDVPLDFTINETFSKTSYSLDGQENITVAGNLTLTRLSNGEHNVTVFATDEAGNTGTSETVCFIVDAPVPFPDFLVVIITVASLSALGIGLLVYFKKHRDRVAT